MISQTDSVHVETNHISCYLFINSSLNSTSLFGVCVCVSVWERHCKSESMHRNAYITVHIGVCVCVTQLCITDSYSSPAVDLQPDSGNAQAAAGHGHLGLAPGNCSPEWGWQRERAGGGRVGGLLGLMWGGSYRTVLRHRWGCVIMRQGRINTPLLPSIRSPQARGMMERGGLNTQLSSAIISDGWSQSRASMACPALTHLNVSAYWCVCVRVCVSYLTVCVHTEER